MRKPEAKYAPAPLYSVLWQQAARRWAQRPVVFRQQWQEHPSPGFLLCLIFIATGISSLIMAAFGFIGGPPRHLLANNEIPELAADLIGSSPEATRRVLGAPALVRREPPAEIWQYRSAHCVLDVYVYDVVRHAEMRERVHADNSALKDDRACLQQLRTTAAK